LHIVRCSASQECHPCRLPLHAIARGRCLEVAKSAGENPRCSSLGIQTYFESKSLARFCCEFLNLQHLAESAVVRKNFIRAARAGLVTFRNVRSWAIHVEFRELPRRCALPADLVFGCRRLGRIGCPRRTSSGGVGGREPLPPKAVGPVPRAEGQASTGRRFHRLDAGGPESMVRLARRAGECPSGHAPALAPPGIPPLLALEVEDGGPATPAQPPPGVDPRDGGGEYHVGTGTHRQRIATETGNPSFSPARSRSTCAGAAPCARPIPSSAGSPSSTIMPR
jgi:hypothetical protein